jgi:hypothetical protein
VVVLPEAGRPHIITTIGVRPPSPKLPAARGRESEVGTAELLERLTAKSGDPRGVELERVGQNSPDVLP